jgi:hypothetical protein
MNPNQPSVALTTHAGFDKTPQSGPFAITGRTGNSGKPDPISTSFNDRTLPESQVAAGITRMGRENDFGIFCSACGKSKSIPRLNSATGESWDCGSSKGKA